jgi:hypothetical protein
LRPCVLNQARETQTLRLWLEEFLRNEKHGFAQRVPSTPLWSGRVRDGTLHVIL